MKKCNRCKIEKDILFFYKTKKYIFPYCKACAKIEYANKHYQANKEIYKQRSIKSQKRFIEEYKKLKAEKKCSVCSESRPWCLDFHHVDPKQKKGAISNIVLNNSRKTFSEEIQKCIVLCKNCHADFHYNERLK